MSLATIIGLLSGFALIIAAMILGGSPASFVDGPAMLIVLGGTFAVTLASFSLREMLGAVGVVLGTLLRRGMAPKRAALLIMEMADRARRDGVLALQPALERLASEPFLRRAVALVIDGTTGDDVERILQREVAATSQRQHGSAQVFRRAAEVAPAMGLIGTLVGLVQMLSHLDDPASIGPAMAIALLTTFYGAVLAYMVFAPIATKLERLSEQEALVHGVYVTGMASIGRRENPRRLEMLLNAMLPRRIASTTSIREGQEQRSCVC